jgi:hypothetical protein
MVEKLHTIAIMAAILNSSLEVFDDDSAARHATNLYEAVERELSKRPVTPQG